MFAFSGECPIRRFLVPQDLAPLVEASCFGKKVQSASVNQADGTMMSNSYHGSHSLRRLINSATYPTAVFLTFVYFLDLQPRNGNI
jgi:hypothetical protein